MSVLNIAAVVVGCCAALVMIARALPRCPSCSARKLSSHGELNHFTIYRCASCGEECMHERGGPYIPRAKWEQGSR